MTQPPRKPKKSETLEVRLPFETKRAFLDTCRENGTTASDVVRSAIDRYLKRNKRPCSTTETRKTAMILPLILKRKRYLAAGAGLAALAGLTALPIAAGPDVRATFQRLDVNGDGVLSMDEMLPEGDHNGQKRVIRIETKQIPDADAGTETEDIEENSAVAFWMPSADAASGDTEVEQRHEIRVIRRSGDAPGPDQVADITQIMATVRKEEFQAFDANRDGAVSFEEYEQRQRAMLEEGFRKLDRDKNGTLSKAEYSDVLTFTLDALPDLADGDEPDRKGKRVVIELKGSEAETKAAIKREGAFDQLDANHDGQLTLKEYMPPS